jgi:hypothetical protein
MIEEINHIYVIPDYKKEYFIFPQTVEYNTLKYLIDMGFICVVGGATSIDRKYRLANGWGYWENESPIYKPKLEKYIDIIATHSAPSFCFPQIKSDIVYEYAKYDESLLDDISKERMVFNKIYEDYKDTITDWFYGHYHQSHLEQINGINFRLLNIEEFCEYRTTDNYNIL